MKHSKVQAQKRRLARKAEHERDRKEKRSALRLSGERKPKRVRYISPRQLGIF